MVLHDLNLAATVRGPRSCCSWTDASRPTARPPRCSPPSASRRPSTRRSRCWPIPRPARRSIVPLAGGGRVDDPQGRSHVTDRSRAEPRSLLFLGGVLVDARRRSSGACAPACLDRVAEAPERVAFFRRGGGRSRARGRPLRRRRARCAFRSERARIVSGAARHHGDGRVRGGGGSARGRLEALRLPAGGRREELPRVSVLPFDPEGVLAVRGPTCCWSIAGCIDSDLDVIGQPRARGAACSTPAARWLAPERVVRADRDVDRRRRQGAQPHRGYWNNARSDSDDRGRSRPRHHLRRASACWSLRIGIRSTCSGKRLVDRRPAAHLRLHQRGLRSRGRRFGHLSRGARDRAPSGRTGSSRRARPMPERLKERWKNVPAVKHGRFIDGSGGRTRARGPAHPGRAPNGSRDDPARQAQDGRREVRAGAAAGAGSAGSRAALFVLVAGGDRAVSRAGGPGIGPGTVLEVLTGGGRRRLRATS